jgi:hypothetical protein
VVWETRLQRVEGPLVIPPIQLATSVRAVISIELAGARDIGGVAEFRVDGTVAELRQGVDEFGPVGAEVVNERVSEWCGINP